MFKSVHLGRIMGIPIYVHWTLLLLFGLIVGTSAKNNGLTAASEVGGLIVCIFLSILAHEFGHIIAARLYGIGTRSVTLSPLGGMASLERYADYPGQRAVIALGGPFVSLILSVVFALWAYFVYGSEAGDSFLVLLSFVNFGILMFNLLPIYPMDGGQVLHAIFSKFLKKSAAENVSLITAQLFSLGLFAIGLWFLNVSLIAISIFLFFVASVELESSWLMKAFTFWRKRDRNQSPRLPQAGPLESKVVDLETDALLEDEDMDLTYGIYVAFDGNGRDFAYARHWKDFSNEEDRRDQKATIEEYEAEARSVGGEIRLLSPMQFDRLREHAGSQLNQASTLPA